MLLDDLDVEPVLTVARLAALHQRHAGDRHFTRTVAEAVASGSPVLERAGAWLLRRQAAVAGGLPSEDWAVVLDGLDGVRSWAGRLLLCQMLAEQPGLWAAAPADVAAFLRGCTGDAQPTVRAWSVCAFHRLARRHPEFRAEARRLVTAARRDPAKCVQARLRHLEEGVFCKP
jgi:hypothetical protein